MGKILRLIIGACCHLPDRVHRVGDRLLFAAGSDLWGIFLVPLCPGWSEKLCFSPPFSFIRLPPTMHEQNPRGKSVCGLTILAFWFQLHSHHKGTSLGGGATNLEGKKSRKDKSSRSDGNCHGGHFTIHVERGSSFALPNPISVWLSTTAEGGLVKAV